MLFKRKNVLCSNCGFMSWQTLETDGSVERGVPCECDLSIRESFQSGKFSGEGLNHTTGYLDRLQCSRRLWTVSARVQSPNMRLYNADAIRQLRQCIYFMKYQPGYSPDEHKELKHHRETKWTIFVATLLGAIIGAITGGLIVVIANLFSNPP